MKPDSEQSPTNGVHSPLKTQPPAMGPALSHHLYRRAPTLPLPPPTPPPHPSVSQGLYFGPHFTVHPENFTQEALNATEGVSSEMLAKWAKKSRAQLASSAQPTSSTALQALVNLRKNTLRIVKHEPSPEGEVANTKAPYHLEFTFDSLVPCKIRVYWVAKETIGTAEDGGEHVLYEFKHALPPRSTTKIRAHSFPRKFNQYFRTSFEPSNYTHEDLIAEHKPATQLSAPASKQRENSQGNAARCDRKEAVADQHHYYPLIVVIEACSPENLEAEPNPMHMQSQATFVTFGGTAESVYEARVVKQTIRINKIAFVLQDIYGFPDRNPSAPKPNRLSTSSTTSVSTVATPSTPTSPLSRRPISTGSQFQDAAEASPVSRECVICISEAKSTVVLPCRHFCLCRDCAETLRLRNNKCPICRSPFRALMYVGLEGEEIEEEEEEIEEEEEEIEEEEECENEEGRLTRSGRVAEGAEVGVETNNKDGFEGIDGLEKRDKHDERQCEDGREQAEMRTTSSSSAEEH
ncbi:hypothetical protein BC936DRAFT_145788 [Jimgerdemannia flammicorona]|uniref:RING-type domain-containing protein n=1 Tax=Jimgerdemannia flammicorona TaxID=994334 RepID=A0A433D991_9FUNG|nr:hypothetical protein BC936DRAFT_145788 [Jimgerdemannia flammicorona]